MSKLIVWWGYKQTPQVLSPPSDFVQSTVWGDLAIEEGMTFFNHPHVANAKKTRGMIIGNMHIVVKDGSINLNRSPFKLTTINA
ncbi:MAG: hypothetical protein ACFFCW_47705 [Candidatus Hodarchaeota archaeon]